MNMALQKFRALGRDEDGAALVTTLAMFFFMFVTLAALFAFGQSIRERIRVQNACDAAAYSAAVVQADTLSRVAVMNRQMAWTYVQMTRRQLDYIIMNMLSRACAHYDSDREAAREYADCVTACELHKQEGAGWFIGANSKAESLERMQVNGLNATLLPSLPLAGHFLNAGASDEVHFLKTSLLAAGAANLADLPRSGNVAMLAPAGSAALAAPIASILKEFLWVPKDLLDAVTAKSDADTLASLKEIGKSLGPHDCGGLAEVKPFLGQIRSQILADRVTIATLNLAERKVVREMPERIEEVVRETLKANLPDRMAKDCRYRVVQEEHPLAFEVGGLDDPTGLVPEGPTPFRGYFDNLRNNHDDERRFLEWAGYGKDKRVAEILGRGFENALHEKTAGGIDQWFVRGNGKQRTEGMVGLQRCFKHWSEYDDDAKNNPYFPSCWNKEHLHESPQTVAPYCEWQWWADKYLCIDFLFIHIHYPYFCKGFMGVGGDCGFSDRTPGLDLFASVMSKLDWLVHTPDVIGAFAGVIGTGLHDCSDAPGDKKKTDSPDPPKPCPMEDYKDGCLVTLEVPQTPSRKPPLVGTWTFYSRIYADDPHLYNEAYVGECAKPLVLRPSYFGKNGTITVCVACRTENAWSRLVDAARGLYSIFNPPGEWVWAFASAKAGCHDPDSETDGDRRYRIAYVKENPHHGSQNKRPWNLAEDDWDAVMVPVRQAVAFAADDAVPVWVPTPGRGIGEWMVKDGWRMLEDGKEANDVDWSKVAMAPPGMGDASGKQGGELDWKELGNVMYH